MLNRRNAIIVLAAGAAGVGYSFLSRPNAGDSAGFDLLDLSANAQEGDAANVDMVLGADDAPVTVVEYASFTCPHCARFHTDTFKDFKKDYIDTGKVKFIYREVYFDRYGLWAGMLARCGGDDKYFAMVDMIYAQQSTWARGADPATISANLKKIGAQAGMDPETVEACLQDAELAQTLYGAYQANAERDNVRSTPSFLINGTMHTGNMPLAQLGGLVDAEL